MEKARCPMSPSRTRNHYRAEFKANALSFLVIDNGYSYSEAGRRLGINNDPSGRVAAFRPYLTMGLALLEWNAKLLIRQISPHQEIGLHILRWVPIGMLPSGGCRIGRKYLLIPQLEVGINVKENQQKCPHGKDTSFNSWV